MRACAHVDALLHKSLVCVLPVGSQRYLYASNSYNALPVTLSAPKSGHGSPSSSKPVGNSDGKDAQGVQQMMSYLMLWCSHT